MTCEHILLEAVRLRRQRKEKSPGEKRITRTRQVGHMRATHRHASFFPFCLPVRPPRLREDDITRERGREKGKQSQRRGGRGRRVCASLAYRIKQTELVHTQMHINPSRSQPKLTTKRKKHTYRGRERVRRTPAPCTQSSHHRNDTTPTERTSQVARENGEEKEEAGLLNSARTCTQGRPLAP